MTLNPSNTYTHLPANMYAYILPTAVENPSLAIFNSALAKDLDLNFDNEAQEEYAQIFSGNKLITNSNPLAQAYAGHQFGNFTVLGDGRAILLGEKTAKNGQLYDIQLKGAGQTLYSRRGDGRASLYAMLREYLISEAMHHLGIDTTRSLAVVLTGEHIRRETIHAGAVLTRVARSHIRVGTFEFASKFNPKETLEAFTNYTIKRHYPELLKTENPALELLKSVMLKQIDLIVHWMRVGFIHGVMNTDNTSICGETIDYGPCAFLDIYDMETVFSSIDTAGRYAYGNQASIIHWNLCRFAESLLPLIHPDADNAIKLATEVLSTFAQVYDQAYLKMMYAKLGFELYKEGDEQLLQQLLNWMQTNKADYTNTFLHIQGIKTPSVSIYDDTEFQSWLKSYTVRIGSDTHSIQKSKDLMSKNNPVYIPRNHEVELALSTANIQNNLKPFHELLAVLSDPYTYNPDAERYQTPASPEKNSFYQTFCGT